MRLVIIFVYIVFTIIFIVFVKVVAAVRWFVQGKGEKVERGMQSFPFRTLLHILAVEFLFRKLTCHDIEKSLEGMHHESHRLLILNSPSNPVGHVYTKSELAQLVACFRSHNILVGDILISFSFSKFIDSQVVS